MATPDISSLPTLEQQRLRLQALQNLETPPAGGRTASRLFSAQLEGSFSHKSYGTGLPPTPASSSPKQAASKTIPSLAAQLQSESAARGAESYGSDAARSAVLDACARELVQMMARVQEMGRDQTPASKTGGADSRAPVASGGNCKSTSAVSDANRFPPRNSVETTDRVSSASNTQHHLRPPLQNIPLNNGGNASTRGDGLGLVGVAGDGRMPNGLFNENAQALSRTSNKSAALGVAAGPLRTLVPERPPPRQFPVDGVLLGMHSDQTEQEVAHALSQARASLQEEAALRSKAERARDQLQRHHAEAEEAAARLRTELSQANLAARQEREARQEAERALRQHSPNARSPRSQHGMDEVIRGLEARLIHERNKRYAAEAAREEARNETAEAQAAASQKTQQAQSLAKAAQDVEARLQASQCEVEGLRSKVSALESRCQLEEESRERAVAVGRQAGEMADVAGKQVEQLRREAAARGRQLAEAHEKVAALQAQVQSAAKQQAHALQEHTHAGKKLEDVSSALAESRRRVAQLTSDLAAANQELEQRDARLAQCQYQAQSLEEMGQSWQSKVQHSAQELHAAVQQTRRLEDCLADMKRQLAEAHSGLEAAAAREARQVQAVEQLQEREVQLTGQLSSAKAELDHVSELQRQLSNATAAQSSLASLQDSHHNLQADLQRREEASDNAQRALRKMISDREASAIEARAEAQRERKRAKQAQEELQHAQARVADLQQAKEALTQEVRVLALSKEREVEAVSSQFQCQLDDLRRQLAQEATTSEAHLRRAREAGAGVEEMRALLEGAEKRLQELKLLVETREATIAKLEADVRDSEQIIEKLRGQLEVAGVEQKLAEEAAQRALSLEATLEQARADLSASQHAKEEAANEVGEAQKSCKQLRQELETLRPLQAKVQELQAELSTARAERDQSIESATQALEEARLLAEESNMKDFQNQLLMEQVGALEMDLNTRDAELSQHREHLEAYAATNQELESQLQSTLDRERDLEMKAAKYSDFEKEREVLVAELLEKDGIIDILREHCGDL